MVRLLKRLECWCFIKVKMCTYDASTFVYDDIYWVKIFHLFRLLMGKLFRNLSGNRDS